MSLQLRCKYRIFKYPINVVQKRKIISICNSWRGKWAFWMIFKIVQIFIEGICVDTCYVLCYIILIATLHVHFTYEETEDERCRELSPRTEDQRKYILVCPTSSWLLFGLLESVRCSVSWIIIYAFGPKHALLPESGVRLVCGRPVNSTLTKPKSWRPSCVQGGSAI